MNPFLAVSLRFGQLLLVAWLPFCLTGCGDLQTQYGPSDGLVGRQSVNGFAALRNTFELASSRIRTRDVYRLSQRTATNDVIVWIPTAWPPMNAQDATNWMENWLAGGNRTLVFIVPDGGSLDDYWQAAARLAPPTASLEYRRRVARQVNGRLLDDDRRDDIQVEDWFVATAIPFTATNEAGQSVRHDLSGNSLFGQKGVTLDESFRRESVATSQIDMGSQRREVTLLAKLTKPEWKNSKIFAVSGGGLLTNFAMTKPASRELAKRIVDETVAAATATVADDAINVAFFNSDSGYISISKAKPGAPNATGMEVLTTWPLSLVTIHGLFLGLVMCLMLLPIFGRPRNVRYNQPTRFGNHLDAMAKLMQRNRTSGSAAVDPYVRERISRYLQLIRGETSGQWITPEPPARKNTEIHRE